MEVRGDGDHASYDDAVTEIAAGSTVLVGGSGIAGIPVGETSGGGEGLRFDLIELRMGDGSLVEQLLG
jgi:hypothetical protein